jgi:hypothetical protein
MDTNYTGFTKYADYLVEVADHIGGVIIDYDKSIKGWSIELAVKVSSHNAYYPIMVEYSLKEHEVIDYLKNEIVFWKNKQTV